MVMMLEQVIHLCNKPVMTPDSFYAPLAGQTVEKIDYQLKIPYQLNQNEEIKCLPYIQIIIFQ